MKGNARLIALCHVGIGQLCQMKKMGSMEEMLSMIPGMSVWQKTLQGAIIIIAVAINYFTERSAARQALRERGALI